MIEEDSFNEFQEESEKEFTEPEEETDLEATSPLEADDADIRWTEEAKKEREKKEVSDEELEQYLPRIYEIYNKQKTETEAYDENDPSHEIIKGSRETMQRAANRVKKGESESWEEERFLAGYLTPPDNVRKIHERYEKIKLGEEFIDRQVKEKKKSPEVAELDRLSLLRKKARLATASGLGGVGITYDKLGDIGKKFDDTMALAGHDELWKFIGASELPFGNSEDEEESEEENK
ncbi:hypothetical protein KAW08_05320 [bacterium]|nr:hypothetical protein [bacterium]